MHEARFEKRARLLKASEFSHVFDKAVRSGDRNFTILARSGGTGCPRLGLAISKKKSASCGIAKSSQADRAGKLSTQPALDHRRRLYSYGRARGGFSNEQAAFSVPAKPLATTQ